MDDAIREHAEAHARAMEEGDLRRAASDLTEEARGAAGVVMAEMPNPVESAEVLSVETSGDEGVVCIRFSGADSATTVESRWAEREGRPMIVDLRLV